MVPEVTVFLTFNLFCCIYFALYCRYAVLVYSHIHVQLFISLFFLASVRVQLQFWEKTSVHVPLYVWILQPAWNFQHLVKCIFVPEDTKQLLVCLYSTERYSPHFNSYQVVKTNQFSLIFIAQLGIFEVYHKYSVSPHSYVVIKSHHHVEYDI